MFDFACSNKIMESFYRHQIETEVADEDIIPENDIIEYLTTALIFQSSLQVGTRFLIAKAESPIEKMMVMALVICLFNDPSAFVLRTKERFHTRLGSVVAIAPYDGLMNYLLETQVKIGKYRVDILLTYAMTVNSVTKWKKAVVECDGHDFHDRTKEQAKKDRARDRWLQSKGYQVYRFTGSEIWQDCFECAREIVGMVYNQEKEEYSIKV